jgi:hypothetical protein
MRKSAQTAKRCRQIEFYEIFITVDGTAPTPAASGIDSRAILSVQDLGAGNYQINLKDKSPQDLQVGGIVSFTASRVGYVTARTQSSVTVQFKDLSGANADADFGISIQWLGTKHLF